MSASPSASRSIYEELSDFETSAEEQQPREGGCAQSSGFTCLLPVAAHSAPTFDNLGPLKMGHTRSDVSTSTSSGSASTPRVGAADFGLRALRGPERPLAEVVEAIISAMAERLDAHLSRILQHTRAGHDAVLRQLEVMSMQMDRLESDTRAGGPSSGQPGSFAPTCVRTDRQLLQECEMTLEAHSDFVQPPQPCKSVSNKSVSNKLDVPERTFGPSISDRSGRSGMSSRRTVKDVFDLESMRTEMVFQSHGLAEDFILPTPPPPPTPARAPPCPHPSSLASRTSSGPSSRDDAQSGSSTSSESSMPAARTAWMDMVRQPSDGTEHQVVSPKHSSSASSESRPGVPTPVPSPRAAGRPSGSRTGVSVGFFISERSAGSNNVGELVQASAHPQPEADRGNLGRLQTRSLGNGCSVEVIRTEREARILLDNVAATVSESQTPALGPRKAGSFLAVVKVLLSAAGAVPWTNDRWSTWYVAAVLVGVGILLAHSLVLAALQSEALYLHLVTACHAMGCLLSLGLLHSRRIDKLLGPVSRPLQSFARTAGVQEVWGKASKLRLCFVLVCWAFMVGCRVAQLVLPSCNAHVLAVGPATTSFSATSLVAFAVIAGVFAMLVYLQLHVCCGLELAVDSFCLRFVQGMDYKQSVLQWGVVQALLRGAARTIDSCFVALGTTVSATLVLTAVSVYQLVLGSDGTNLRSLGHCSALWSGWILAPVVMLLYATFCAAAVTEKCQRVAPFVNLWAVEAQPIDFERQFASLHILHSAAGFYVKGVRLSGSMALKLVYLFGVVLFTFLTRAVLAV